MTNMTLASSYTNNGLRRYTPAMLQAQFELEALDRSITLDDINGLTKWNVLCVLEDIYKELNLSKGLLNFITCLIKQTQAKDWQGNNLLIVSSSNRHLCDCLDIENARLKYYEREAAEKGLILFRDNPSGGKRWIKREYGKNGRIISGYGIDLHPLRLRYSQFKELQKTKWENRRKAEASRKNIFFLRKTIHIFLQSLKELEAYTEKDQVLSSHVDTIAKIKKTELNLKVLQPIENELLEIHFSLKRRISGVFSNDFPVKTSPLEFENKPLIHLHQNHLFKEKVEVQNHQIAQEAISSQNQSVQKQTLEKKSSVLNGFIAIPYFILQISMMFKEIISTANPNHQQIIEAAASLCPHLRINQYIWGQACIIFGRYEAAVCVAIIAARYERGTIKNGGGFLRALIERHQAGTLHLDKTLFGLADLITYEKKYNQIIN